MKKRQVKFRQELVDNDIILSVRHLKQFFRLGNVYNKAVHDVSFDVKKGECMGLVGESGCGKTTTGRSIIKLYNITSGSVYFNGYRISGGDRWNRKEIKWKRIKTKEQIDLLKYQMKEEINEINDPSQEGNDDRVQLIKEKYNSQINALKEEEKRIVLEQKEKIAQIKYDNKNCNKEIAKTRVEKEYAPKLKELDDKINNLLSDENHSESDIQSLQEEKRLLQKEYKNALKKAKKELFTSKIQMIFQDPIDSLDPRMTVEDIINEGLVIQGHKNRSENLVEVAKSLEKVGLLPEHATRYPHEFSGGQRQRIGIARALVMKPELLICDEPISALDVSIRAQVINLLNDLKEEYGLTILFIAHDLSVVKYFCDRIAVMYFGEIVEMASSDELFKHPLHPYTKALLSAIPKPNPLTEKKRERVVYNPLKDHDYSKEAPTLVEIVDDHFVLANSEEIKKYKEEIIKVDEGK